MAPVISSRTSDPHFCKCKGDYAEHNIEVEQLPHTPRPQRPSVSDTSEMGEHPWGEHPYQSQSSELDYADIGEEHISSHVYRKADDEVCFDSFGQHFGILGTAWDRKAEDEVCELIYKASMPWQSAQKIGSFFGSRPAAEVVRSQSEALMPTWAPLKVVGKRAKMDDRPSNAPTSQDHFLGESLPFPMPPPTCRPTLLEASQPPGCQPVHAASSCPVSMPRRSLNRSLTEAQLGTPSSLVPELCPGDVLSIIDNDFGITRLGAAGGLMGHVLLVASPAQRIERQSEVGRVFRRLMTSTRDELYSVGIIECSRATEGLYEVNVVLSVDESGQVTLRGEYRPDEIIINEGLQEVHIWRSPSKFRGGHFRLDVMYKVLEDMKSNQRSWSWSTAVRALFFSGVISSRRGVDTMKEIEDCWQNDPICTSIIVTFWQRYLQKLAIAEAIDPLDLILQFMPLRADSVLPGELLNTMLSRGWSLWQAGPQRTMSVDSWP